jgi:polysaccharide deacetylase family protein (PEP-CTERM system associated)
MPADHSLSLRTERATLVPPTDSGQPRNAFTVDVEDWYQSCVDYDAPITERVVRNVERVLALLDECEVRASFFVQGKVAETYPNLVRSLVAAGHEVQAHGYSHRPLYAMNRTELRVELDRAKKTVEDAAGTAVTTFRAPDFSIGLRNLWAFEMLADIGFEVDSSLFPMRSGRYGLPSWEVAPHHLVSDAGVRILEVPVAIWGSGRLRFPVAGGGYFRFVPRRVVEQGLKAIEADGRPAIVYCHPYEFADDDFAELPDVSRRTRVTQAFGRRRFPNRIRALFSDFKFGRLDTVLAAWRLQ